MKNNVFVILGPTSSGKTSLALKLCKKYNGEILSADSRQVYTYMDIGTGKLPVNSGIKVQKDDKRWLLDGVTIWGYDLVDPDQYFSAYYFGEFARTKTSQILGEGKTAFVVGGTGFYMDILTGRINPSHIPPDFALRQELKTKTLLEIKHLATSLNLTVPNESEVSNKQRLIRKIEMAMTKQKSPTPPLPEENINFVLIGLTAPRSFLYSRADKWVEAIWANGITDEVLNLRNMGFGNSPKLTGLVYKEVSEFLDGAMGEPECIKKVKYSLHAYIRRQQTYFKKIPDVKWFDISQDRFEQNIYNLIEGYAR